MTLLESSTEVEEQPPFGTPTPSSSGIDVLALDHHDRLTNVLLRLGQFRTLPAGWNSYGSAPPSSELIQLVESFVSASDSILSPFLPPPHPVPTSGGGIKLTWECGDRELELEFCPIEDGQIEVEYLRISYGEAISEGHVERARELQECLTWVIQG